MNDRILHVLVCADSNAASKGGVHKECFSFIEGNHKGPVRGWGGAQEALTPTPRLIKENRKRSGQSITVSQNMIQNPNRAKVGD